jgi:hypothetical protein
MGRSEIQPQYKGRGAGFPAEGKDGGEETDDVEQRKEKVLHTRIPESLDRRIKKRARNLGMSVSTVVRNVLLHTFDLVEDIVTDSTNLALSIAGDGAERSDTRVRHRRAAHGVASTAEVLAWQEAVLNLNAVCDRCNAVLEKGTRAAIGLRDAPGPQIVICAGCLAALAGPEVR